MSNGETTPLAAVNVVLGISPVTVSTLVLLMKADPVIAKLENVELPATKELNVADPPAITAAFSVPVVIFVDT